MRVRRILAWLRVGFLVAVAILLGYVFLLLATSCYGETAPLPAPCDPADVTHWYPMPAQPPGCVRFYARARDAGADR